MAEGFVLTDEMKANIGWKSKPWIYNVDVTGVQAFARGVKYKDLVYYDADAAKEAGYSNIPAPPTYLGTPVFIPGKTDPIFGGPIDGTVDLKTGLKAVVDGESEIEYFAPIYVGDTLSVVMQLADLKTRESKSVGVMLLEQYETTYTNQDNKVAAIFRFQVIRY